jgi:anti-sigma B factor antagonist
MNIVTASMGDATVVRLRGRFDAHEVAEVRKALDAAQQMGGAQVVVNLAGVNFIDSSGLAALVAGMKHCRGEGGDLHLCELLQPLRIIFELTRLDRAFAIFGSEAEALGAFEGATAHANWPPAATTAGQVLAPAEITTHE